MSSAASNTAGTTTHGRALAGIGAAMPGAPAMVGAAAMAGAEAMREADIRAEAAMAAILPEAAGTSAPARALASVAVPAPVDVPASAVVRVAVAPRRSFQRRSYARPRISLAASPHVTAQHPRVPHEALSISNRSQCTRGSHATQWVALEYYSNDGDIMLKPISYRSDQRSISCFSCRTRFNKEL